MYNRLALYFTCICVRWSHSNAHSTLLYGEEFLQRGIAEEKLQLGVHWARKFCNRNVKLEDKTDINSEIGKRNKILGMATGPAYTFDKLVLFCKSVRKSGFGGKVLIGISKLKYSENRRRIKMFKKFNITGVYLEGVKGGGWGQSICRYYAYMKMVEMFASEHDMILLSDVRDVFFQDPFLSSPFGSRHFLNDSTNILLFNEGLNDLSKEKATLRTTKINYRWLKNIYGIKEAEMLGHNPVLCSGTTIGTKLSMIYYTRAMLYEGYLCLKRNPERYDGRRGHVCSGGADQGFHNYLFWNNLLVGATMVQNAAGPVYTIGIFRGKPVRSLDFERSESGEIISPSARGPQHPVPVIHQWDRHNDFLQYVFQKFALTSEGISKRVFASHLLDGGFSG